MASRNLREYENAFFLSVSGRSTLSLARPPHIELVLYVTPGTLWPRYQLYTRCLGF